MKRIRANGVTATLVALLVLGLLPSAGAHAAARGSPSDVLAIYQSPYTTEQQNFTVSVQVVNPAAVHYAYFTFCQLSSPVCYLPVSMTLHGTNWFVGTTHAMTSYSGMTVGVRAGYNVTIIYNDNTNITEPSIPNHFGNLTIAQSVTGEYMFQMTVGNQLYRLSGVVTDVVTGAAVAGAKVTLTPGNNTTTSTSSTGAYVFNGVANGTYTVAVSASHYPLRSQSVDVSGQNAVKDIQISNATTPVHPTSGGGAKGLFFGPILGLSPLGIALIVAVVAVALGLVALLRARRAASRPPVSPAASSSEGAGGPK